MKKALAIVIALLLVVSLFACTRTTPATSPSASASAAPSSAPPSSAAPSSASSEPSVSASAPASPVKVEPGFFDPTIDYSKNKRYKIVYMMSSTGVLWDAFSKAFAKWAAKLNCDYSDFGSNADNDLYLNTIQTYADQGVNGLLLDPDSTIYPRIVELLNELKMPWMGCMAAPYDQDGKTLLHPNVGFDNVGFGKQMATWTIDYAKKNWTGATKVNTGMLSVNFSLSPQINERTIGAKQVFLEAGYPEKNFFMVDGATAQKMDSQTGFDLAAPTYAGNPQIKYWLICACLDDYADGAVRAAEQASISSNCVATTCGGSGLINHWDAGEDSAWKSAVFTDQSFYAEPIVNALYAFMSGTSTPEAIWPEWVNHARGDKYASLILPTQIITKDMYQSYLEFVDNYTGFNTYPYSTAPGKFTTRAEVPASYKAQ